MHNTRSPQRGCNDIVFLPTGQMFAKYSASCQSSSSCFYPGLDLIPCRWKSGQRCPTCAMAAGGKGCYYLHAPIVVCARDLFVFGLDLLACVKRLFGCAMHCLPACIHLTCLFAFSQTWSFSSFSKGARVGLTFAWMPIALYATLGCAALHDLGAAADARDDMVIEMLLMVMMMGW